MKIVISIVISCAMFVAAFHRKLSIQAIINSI
jgi:hypothetical protein